MGGGERNYWLWVFGEIGGLRWVLERNQMAFATHAATRIQGMSAGDEAVLYVTRGAFHNPTRDEARLRGLVKVTGSPRQSRPVIVAARQFSYLVDFEPLKLFPERQGPPVRPLLAQLERVKRPEVWGQYFRNSPIRLSRHDFQVLEAEVRSYD